MTMLGENLQEVQCLIGSLHLKELNYCNGAMKSERRKGEWCNWGTATAAARGLSLEAECHGLTHTYCHNEQGQ